MVRQCISWFGFLLIVGLVACGGEDSQQAAGGRGRGGGRARRVQALPVKVESVVRQEIASYILRNTTLEAERWVDVRSRTSGQVISIMKEEGDSVRPGTILARLDAAEIKITVALREVAFREAKQRYEREEMLFQRNLGSQERFENAKTQMESASAQMEQAKLNLSYTEIRAPISGVLTHRNIEIGNLVTNNQVVFSMANFNPLLARIQVTEKDFGKIIEGQTARITVEAASGKEFRGRVKMISPVVDPASGTIKVTVEIPSGGDTVLRPGMFASVYIITETHADALVIPKKALVLEGEGNQVFVYEQDPETGMGKAARKRVEIGFSDSERLEVVSGLAVGEQVITVGQDGLRPGAAIRLVGEGVASSGGRGGRGGRGRQGAGVDRGGGRGGEAAQGGGRGGQGGGSQAGGGQGGGRGQGRQAGGEVGGQSGARRGQGGQAQGEAVQQAEGRSGSEVAQGGGRRGGGRGGQGRGGQGSGGDISQVQERLFSRFPDLKTAYDERVKTDPEVGTNPEKWQAFVQEMREAGVIPARRGRGGGGE
ncbi:MAG: efflux RND transporter periplasmic adaptor subunit [bacterium]|nr:efflux RND transporter periplasmic adaptor subunit [bacterium]